MVSYYVFNIRLLCLHQKFTADKLRALWTQGLSVANFLWPQRLKSYIRQIHLGSVVYISHIPTTHAHARTHTHTHTHTLDMIQHHFFQKNMEIITNFTLEIYNTSTVASCTYVSNGEINTNTTLLTLPYIWWWIYKYSSCTTCFFIN